MKNKLLTMAALNVMFGGIDLESTFTSEPVTQISRGRCGEKDLEKIRKAEQKRARRAAKRRG